MLLLFVARVLRLPERVYLLFLSPLSFLFLPSFLLHPTTTHSGKTHPPPPPHLPFALSHTHSTLTLHSLIS
jgi:hypothetical protein